MLLGNKVSTLSPKWADVRTDGLRGRREGRHRVFWIKPTFIYLYLGLCIRKQNTMLQLALTDNKTYDETVAIHGNSEYIGQIISERAPTIRKSMF